MRALGQKAQQPLLRLRDRIRSRNSYGVEALCARRPKQGRFEG